MKISNILFDCARNSGSPDVAIAEKYLEADEWGSAVQTIQKMLKKGHAPADGKAFWILGHAHLKQGQVRLACSAFENAARFESYQAKAKFWLDTVRQR